MRAAARGLLDLSVGLGRSGVDRDVGAAFTRQFEFVVGHVNGDDFRAIRLRELDRQMAESADAEDSDFCPACAPDFFIAL